jgi:acyl carrier protein
LTKDQSAFPALFLTIYFSSAAALLGSAGQGSYAAANAYLDGLAQERSARGLRTLSVNWGAWAGAGMVERLNSAAKARLERQGIRTMLPAAALAGLERAVLSGVASVAIADVDWSAYAEQFEEGSGARDFFLSFLPGVRRTIDAVSVPKSVNLDAEEITAIMGAARTERLPRMEGFVRAAARKVLGLSAGRPMPGETPLQELGLDSLMALELRNVLAQSLGRPLSATLLFDYPTIRGLAAYLLPFVLPVDVQKSELEREGVTSDLEAELAGMTDAEAEELLLAELDGKVRP